VTDSKSIMDFFSKISPDIVVHLAWMKHAPLWEEDPSNAFSINTIWTLNLINSLPQWCKIIMSSTCKACNPETAYGASKLLAERVVLKNNWVVARFYNVVETSWNVFEIWNWIDETKPLPVVEKCERYFISLQESVWLLLYCLHAASGIYVVSNVLRRSMWNIASALYPNREIETIPPRIWDRVIELLHATHETVICTDTFGIWSVVMMDT
jgi:FlaA1/EpsC-like NDP-sugar epimerase